MLRLEIITEDKCETAKECYHKIFSWLPAESDPYTTFLNASDEEKAQREAMKTENYLVYDDDRIVGLSGKYSYPFELETAWLGWFGVLPEMRRFHYGSKILKLHEEVIRSQGYKYSRIYTETFNNDATKAFYEKNGYAGELYNCPEDRLVPKDFVTIYSKALGEYPLELWNNKNMMLSELETGMVSEEQLQNIEELLKQFTNSKHE